MCGMLGAIGLARFDVEGGLDRIAHRGPDGRGIVEVDGATHGHVRLSLVDLTDASAQPYRRGNGVLSFVGEIWNWRDLRRRLETSGKHLMDVGPQSDTAMLAAALALWGVERTLPLLDGMFAFAWSDGCGGHWLVRDRFGKVPLHVCRFHGGGWAWCSEIKGLGPGRPSSSLSPGCVLDLVKGEVRRWYDLPKGFTGALPPEHVMAWIEEGVRLRLAADAPLCVLCSGGLDSSLILAVARKLKPDIVAFTAVHDPDSPYLKAARRLCHELSVPLREVPVAAPTADDLAGAVRTVEISSKAQVEIAALCLPLARAISADGFKACLSGEAADELFGGYGNMCIAGSRADDAGWRTIREHQLTKMAGGNFVRCNKAFMAAGVECRLPFMHRPLVEAVMTASKAACPPGKKLLKAAARSVIPPWIVNRTKQTFQGASGMADAAARAVANPKRFYTAEHAAAFGPSL
jgi:asparagine synthase (glutamine-hydrolysing)